MSRPFARPRITPDLQEENEEVYMIDLVAIISFAFAIFAAVFMSYWFIIAQVSESSELMIETANFVIYLGVALSGMVGVIVLALMSLRIGCQAQSTFEARGRTEFCADFKDAASTIFYGLLFAGVIGAVTYPIITVFGLSASVSAYSSDFERLLTGLAPVGEEFFSRGFVYGLCAYLLPGPQMWKFLVRGGVSSSIFAIQHFWARPLTLGTLLFIGASGMVLAFSYWYRKRLGVPVIAHFGWNLFMMRIQGLI